MTNIIQLENQYTTPQKSAARRFLRSLDPAAESFTFQTYDDDKARDDKLLARTIVGTLDDCWPALVAANANGCAVHVTINHTVGNRRTAKDVDYVRKHFIEVDGTKTLEQILAGPLKPALINESSPGKYHVYFDIAGDVRDDVAGFKRRQLQLIALYNSGRESSDLPRVLRLPGFFHKKDPSNPFLVRTVYASKSAPAYSVADLEGVLKDIAVAAEIAAERDAEPAAPEDAAAIAAVTEFFKTDATPAIANTPTGKAGKQGNSTAFDMMVRARDEGVEQNTCLDLALTYYNERCDPPWSYEELETIVANAYAYAQNTQGKDSALADFADDEVTEDELETKEPPRLFIPTSWQPIEPSKVKPRDWQGFGHYIRGFVVGDVAPGGMGKSSVALVEAISMALGRDLLGTGKIYWRRQKVWYWGGEDPAEETQRRIAAICKHYKINQADLVGYLFTDSGRDTPIKIGAAGPNNPTKIARPQVGRSCCSYQDARD